MSKPMSTLAEKKGKCAICNRAMTRTKRFKVDPNRGYSAGWAEAKEAADAWEPEGPWEHPKCVANLQIPGQTTIEDVLQ